ncbi:MAG TPA: serine/threonine-protein kinase [Gammaproteobacteria bacterium]|nr:serine/threonine-protein kinase [Gammaproteobacteria bacterium]
MSMKIGKYTLGRELGRGASSIVYLAENDAGRQVALKLYASDKGMSEKSAKLYRKLFFTEARMAGRLLHPNILPILDAGEENDLRFVVMTYLENYHAMTRHTKPDTLLPIKTVVKVFFAMSKALDYAHRNGVIHRDIKPANVMMNDAGHVMIVDFGVAKSAFDETTHIGGIVGTPRYMAPEQINDQEITNQSDIFSMGVTIYELLTGIPPFISDTLPGLTNQILNHDPKPVTTLRTDIPEPLNRIVMRCVKKPLKTRYKTCMDIAGDLINVSDDLDTKSAEVTEQEHYNMVSNLSFFRDFTQPEIWEIIRAGAWKRFRKGDTMITEGELDENFFVIASGEASVHKGKTVLGTLTTGDCFGEMGYLSRTKRSASVRANSEVALLCVNATLMERASRDCQLRFYKVFAHTLIERLSRTNERLLAAGV